MEYALITAFLILVILLSVLAYIGHGYVKNDIKSKKLERRIIELESLNRGFEQKVTWYEEHRATPTLKQAIDWTNYRTAPIVPTSAKISLTSSYPQFTSTQYDEH